MVVILSIASKSEARGPSTYPPVTFAPLQLAQRGDWSGLLCYRKAPGCLLAGGCCVQCPASPPRPMPEETTGRMSAFIRFVS